MKPLEMPKKRSRKKRARRNNSKANVQPSADADDHPDEEPLMIEGNMEYASVRFPFQEICTDTPHIHCLIYYTTYILHNLTV